MARPRKDIDKAHFEKLCGIMCTLEEVASFFDCDPRTIERFCKREYNESFVDVSKKKQGLGRISLRRAQFRLAEKNATMAIFLGKNYLGQADVVQQEVNFDDGFIEALAKSATSDWDDES